MKISVVIVNWNTCEYLAPCLESVFAYPPDVEYEVWVVDNNSTDGSFEFVRDHFPQVKLIGNDSNIGFAAANNQAIRKTSGEYILLLNPDTLLKEGAVQHLLTFLEATPNAAVAGPLILNPDLTLQASSFKSPTLLKEFWRLFHLDRILMVSGYPISRWNTQKAQEVEVLLGACMLLRRSAMTNLDVLDEDFYMYSEEIDLCYRLRKADWQIFWVPEASIVHYGGQSTSQVPAKMFLHLYKSKVQFFRKHYQPPQVFVYKTVLTIASMARIVFGHLLGILPIESASRYRTTANRYMDLIRSLPDL